VSKVQEIERAIQQLSNVEMRELHAWLENVMEDQLELKEEFKSKIESSERELAEGKRPRVHLP
jgi:hypothetical protein